MSGCACNSSDVLFFACSGGSNVGQLSNAAAAELAQQDHGKMYCLAGLGGAVSGIVESTKAARLKVAIDGCSIGCAKAIFDRLGLAPEIHVVVTELGIEKNHTFDISSEDLNKTCEAVIREIAEQLI